jgi:hypothetical protein
MKYLNRPAAAIAATIALFTAAAGARAAEDDETTRLIAELGLQESATALADRPGWQAPRKVVVVGADAERIAWMQPAAPGVTLVGALDQAAGVAAVTDADAMIGECYADVIGAGPRLRWVQRMYAGVERCVTIPAFTERGIVLTNMQKIAGPVMSEHVLALMFGLRRGANGRTKRFPRTGCGRSKARRSSSRDSAASAAKLRAARTRSA